MNVIPVNNMRFKALERKGYSQSKRVTAIAKQEGLQPESQKVRLATIKASLVPMYEPRYPGVLLNSGDLDIFKHLLIAFS